MTDPVPAGRPGARSDAPWPRASTRGLAVLGWPVRHSLSPVMHNAALSAQGIDLAYLALPVPPDRLLDVVAALGTAGFVGANVTVPHKQAVMDACDRLTDEARLIGAVNTLHWVGEEVGDEGSIDGAVGVDGRGATGAGLLGDNTDAVGLQRALEQVAATEGSAVLLGTGGAARAAVVALARRGAPVVVVGRRPDAAAEVAEVGARAGGTATALGLDDAHLDQVVRDAALVVNATPVGMGHESLPAPFMSLTAGQTAYDLVYAPPDTPFLQAAATAGAAAHHGLSMLVHQAAASYERWTGHPAPVDVMTEAAEGALAAT